MRVRERVRSGLQTQRFSGEDILTISIRAPPTGAETDRLIRELTPAVRSYHISASRAMIDAQESRCTLTTRQVDPGGTAARSRSPPRMRSRMRSAAPLRPRCESHEFGFNAPSAVCSDATRQ